MVFTTIGDTLTEPILVGLMSALMTFLQMRMNAGVVRFAGVADPTYGPVMQNLLLSTGSSLIANAFVNYGLEGWLLDSSESNDTHVAIKLILKPVLVPFLILAGTVVTPPIEGSSIPMMLRGFLSQVASEMTYYGIDVATNNTTGDNQ